MTEPLAPIFASTYLYGAHKNVGAERWDAWLAHQLAHLDESAWAGLRTLGELKRVCTFDLVTDNSTYITRARSVMAGRFLRGSKDVWLTVDDDVYADEDVLRRVVLACRETRAGVAVPYINRNGLSMTFRRLYGPTLHLDFGSQGSASLRSVDRIGFGLVALHRDLVMLLAKDAPMFREGNDGKSEPDCPALFLEGAQDGDWVGEDYYASRLCEDAGKPLWAMLSAPCEHAGITAMVDMQGHIRVQGLAAAETLDRAFREREREAETGRYKLPPE